jgi:6-phosphogluconolactonase (cycloisomerase 2 family)
MRRVGATFSTGKAPRSLGIDPGGNHLYVLNQDDSTISAFNIHAQSGFLREIPGSPYAIGETPTAFAIHPNGRLVYVANMASSNIATFDRNPLTGVLTERPPRLSVAGSPTSIAIDASGQLVYIGTKTGIQILKIGENDGRLKERVKVSTDKTPTSISLDQFRQLIR